MIKCEPVKDYTKHEHKDAISKAKEVIKRKLYELQFATLPKKEQEALRKMGLDPESKYSENRMIETR